MLSLKAPKCCPALFSLVPNSSSYNGVELYLFLWNFVYCHAWSEPVTYVILSSPVPKAHLCARLSPRSAGLVQSERVSGMPWRDDVVSHRSCCCCPTASREDRLPRALGQGGAPSLWGHLAAAEALHHGCVSSAGKLMHTVPSRVYIFVVVPFGCWRPRDGSSGAQTIILSPSYPEFKQKSTVEAERSHMRTTIVPSNGN